MSQIVKEKEPKWLVFLVKFAKRIEQRFDQEDLEGKIKWEVKELKENVKCIEIIYTDDENEPAIFHMLVSRRYFGKSMIRLKEIGTSSDVSIQADPLLVVSRITF